MLDCQKPKKKRKPAVKKIGDREICNLETREGREIYAERTSQMASRQRFRCAICKHPQLGMQFDHESGRGHGGGHRNDAITNAEGEWINAALCSNCNQWKGSKRYKWINGQYLPTKRLQEVA